MLCIETRGAFALTGPDVISALSESRSKSDPDGG